MTERMPCVHQILFHFPLPWAHKMIASPSLLCRQVGTMRLVVSMGCKQMWCVCVSSKVSIEEWILWDLFPAAETMEACFKMAVLEDLEPPSACTTDVFLNDYMDQCLRISLALHLHQHWILLAFKTFLPVWRCEISVLICVCVCV